MNFTDGLLSLEKLRSKRSTVEMRDKRKEERERKQRLKMFNALATVSSLAAMIVFDFLLAYFGGDWLDEYFKTGDHTFRLVGISLAIVTIFLTFFKLVYSVMQDEDD